MAPLPVRPEPFGKLRTGSVEGPGTAPRDAGTRPQPRRRLWVLAALLGVLATSGFLRFYGFADKGIFDSDAANYVREGRLLAGIARAGAGMAGRFVEERVTGKDTFRWEEERASLAEVAALGSPPGYARPTHTLLVALSLLLLADDPGAGNAVAAAFGTATIGLMFIAARHFYSHSATGLVAAVILGFSTYHVIYSREGIPDAETGFFVLLATYCYWLSTQTGRSRWLAAAGGLAGLVYTANDRWIIVMVLFTVPEVWSAVTTRVGKGRLCRRLAVLYGAMATPLLLWELAYYSVLVLSRLYGQSFFPLAQPPAEGLLAYLQTPQQPTFLTYFEQLLLHFTWWTPTGFDPNLWVYPFHLWQLQGPWTLILLATAAALYLAPVMRRVLVARASPQRDFTLWWHALAIVAFFSALYYHHPRLITLALPALALLAAGAWHRWVAVTRNLTGGGVAMGTLRASPWLFAAGLALHGLASALPALQMRTGLPDALAYVRSQGGFLHLSLNHPISRVFMGEGSAFPADSTLTMAQATKLLEQGYRYLVVALYEFTGRNPHQLDEPMSPFFARAFARCEPSYVAPDRGDLYFYKFAYDALPNPGDAALLLASFTPEVRRTANRVYDLKSCLDALDATGP